MNSFIWALDALQRGMAVRRGDWAPECFIALEPRHSDGRGLPRAAHLVLTNADEVAPGWLPCADDLFALDWEGIEQ